MKKLYTILFFLKLSSCFTQGDQKIIKQDFDGDGSNEKLILNYYLGKIDFAVLYYEKKTKKCTLDIKATNKHPSLINTIPLCDDLLKPEYKKITQFVDSIIFNIPASKNLDLTLGWLLDVYSSKKIITDHPYFISRSKFKTKIKNGTYESPSSHRILVKGKLVKKINQLHQKSDTTAKSWITFDANLLNNARQITEYELNPSWPQFIDSVGPIEIYKTGHSVFIETDTMHQVLFASDGVLFQNLQKLNWESIQQVGTYKKYYLVLTQPYPGIENKLFLIDLLRGLILEFRKDVLLDFKNYYLNIESFDIMEDELFLFIRKSPNFDYKIKEKSISMILIDNSIKILESK
ncbi:MAG: hypothetical protein CMD18_06975 [Flavobacteriales bacterium]|nr:hypothetical protein [Flavobacteriales bacterium]